jgi:hypothetical protein
MALTLLARPRHHPVQLFHSRHRVARIVGLFGRKVIFQEMHPNINGELYERRRTKPNAGIRQEENPQENAIASNALLASGRRTGNL